MRILLTILFLFGAGAGFAVFAADSPLVIRKVAIAEYRTGYLYSNGGFYSFESGRFIRYNYGGRRIVDCCAGFNLLLALDDQGFVWTTQLGRPEVVKIATDSAGAAFDKNEAIFGYANGHTSIRSDKSLWYWGDDTFHLFHSTGGVRIRPVRISPEGMRVKKVVMSWFRIEVLTENGEVWEWLRGKGVKPVQKVLPGKATDIFNSQWDYAGCIIGGYPYIWGTEFGFWGGSGPSNEPFALRSLWKMSAPVKAIVASFNTIHYIDTRGRLFGIGDNAMGEIGNGTELVNQSHYLARYSWTFNKAEKLTGAPPIQIGKGIKWKNIWADNFLAFYKYAVDENDNLYFWGRDKALASGRGFINMDEAAYPNALDVLEPLKVDPLTAIYQPYKFVQPSLEVVGAQSVTGSSVELSGVAKPPMLVRSTLRAANGIDTLSYDIERYEWTQLSGKPCKIVSPHSARTVVEGLQAGEYVFNLKTTDSNRGTQSKNVVVRKK